MTLAFAPERIEHWPLAHLQPYARNAKQHGADQLAKLAASMAEFGWTVPCLVAEDGELIAGHGRVLAATQLGLTEAPVIVLGTSAPSTSPSPPRRASCPVASAMSSNWAARRWSMSRRPSRAC